MVRWGQALGLVAAATVLAACGSGSSSTTAVGPTPSEVSSSPGHESQPTRPTRHTRSPEASADPSPSTVGSGPTKVLVFMVENHSLDEMRTQMPWTAALADRYGYATAYHAMTHPSLPNYLAIAGGSTFGVQDDNDPSSHPISGSSVFGEALAAGRTARVYAEAMPGTCATTPSGTYAVKHNPWAYFVDERAACDRYDVPIDQLAGDIRTGSLPGAGMVVADMCHIAHDCPLGTADAWLRSVVGPVLAGPDFRKGRLVVVITADEDDRSDDNRVLTVVASAGMPAHQVVSTPLTHLSLTRLYAEVLHLTPLRGAAGAPSLAQAFHLGVTGG
jgi:phosphatidylinositol-3-phosphatase